MSPTVAQGMHEARLNAEWDPSQPSPAPIGREVLNNANKETTREQQALWQTVPDPENISSQNYSSDKQTASNAQHDGQYHRNQQSSPDKPVLSNTQDDGQYHENKQPSPDRQTASNPQNDGQYHRNQQSSPDKPVPPNTQDDGQYHRNQQFSPDRQTASNAQDDGQYHRNQQFSPDRQVPPNTPDDGAKEGPLTSSSDVQNHPEQRIGEGYPQINQASTSTQHGPSINADGSQQLSWNEAAAAGGIWNSAIGDIQSPTTTQLHPLHTTSLTRSITQATSTSAPSIPASSTSGSGSTASSPAARAGIALSVTGAVGLIAILILLPLYKRRKRLRGVLDHGQKKFTEAGPPPKETRQSLNGFISKVYSHSARMVCLTTDYLIPKRQASNHDAYLGDTHIGSETNKAVRVSDKSPPIEIYPAAQPSTPISVASWETERSKMSSNDSVAHSEDQKREQTGSPNLGHVYGLGQLENLSVGNLIAINPRMNNIYTVEIDYNPRRADQLELRVGQHLCILQTFDNGWAMGVHLNCAEAGLVPRSHISAVPDSGPLQCTGEDTKSKRYSVQRSSNSLTSRFYSLFKPSAQLPHPSSLV
ncbi:hypothetical protein VN97_g7869 [Penicillium thymicola]|uniref:SH3 domain-containing protein n=1 Tax=Penicillium thymicola TaxID=293382 RepID=A0AAI9X657_PENTH|nr:hypothetical protein VN97_g7869 [Penicillium thymicola]